MYFWITNFLLRIRFLERWMIEDFLGSALVRWEFYIVFCCGTLLEVSLWRNNGNVEKQIRIFLF